MSQGARRWTGLLIVWAFIPGCLLNSVHSMSRATRTKPDKAHAIVVIGIGLNVSWPYTNFPVTFVEYSAEKQQITGNCFHYNRIEATVPSSPAKVKYLAFEVPANVYAVAHESAPNAMFLLRCLVSASSTSRAAPVLEAKPDVNPIAPDFSDEGATLADYCFSRHLRNVAAASAVVSLPTRTKSCVPDSISTLSASGE
jgi:hypothetical protein